jgi:putative transposase
MPEFGATFNPAVSTVGRDEAVIREYIRNQEKEDQRLDQLNLWK